ncbi:DNA primase family protein [Roseovarius nubinhibens]|uniref:DNA primase family protein n=1 Tax=Roseovarius nubinhibens TaxID=314263 RepID=UPI0030EF5EAE|tara:strand:+ start:7655 stop:9208 length:1554 start_codon:yes stop_codon:yes gene_type:complete
MRDYEEGMDERLAVLADVESDDTSLAQAWIAVEGGDGKCDTEILRVSDGSIRRFDRAAGIWRVLCETDTRRSLSEFLCDVGDAKLEVAEAKLRQGEIEGRDRAAAVKLRTNLRSQTRLKAVWQTAMVHMDTAEIDDFDANPELLGTPNGVIDLRTGETRPATVADMVTQRTATAPASSGTRAPDWETFLSEVFSSEAEMIGFIQRMFGSALVGDVSPQKFFVLFGDGANGKSVLREILGRLAGSYAATASAKVFMQSHGDRHPTEIASLAGKRLVLASEVPAGRLWNETLLKDLTGGEKMTARKMHQDEFSFTPCGTVIFTANTLPSFPNAQEAMLRRILLVPMKREFTEEEQNPNLVEELIAKEGPAILRWVIDGAGKFLSDGGGVKGLRIPQTVTDATRMYFEEEDIVLQFLIDVQGRSDTLNDWSKGGFLSNNALLGEFNQWAHRNGYKAWSVRSLTKAIREGAERYGLSEKRVNAARGFKVERRLAVPPTGAKDKLSKPAKHAVIEHLRAGKK